MLHGFSLPINVLTLALPFAGALLRHHFPTPYCVMTGLETFNHTHTVCTCVGVEWCMCEKLIKGTGLKFKEGEISMVVSVTLLSMTNTQSNDNQCILACSYLKQ